MNITRSARFAMQVPPAKLLARARLLAKRKSITAARRLGLAKRTGLERPGLASAQTLPQLLFRSDRQIEVHGDDFHFNFLNQPEIRSIPIDWRRSNQGKNGQLWLMNLHYMEYIANLRDHDLEKLVRDWIASVPPLQPNYWMFDWNAYSLSIRVVALMGELARRAERLSADFVELAHRSLVNQIAFLERNLETDICGNHIIKNIKALAWAGAYFTGEQAQSWRRRALILLERELRDQILDDGLHFERSTSYHAQVLGDLLETRVALGPKAVDDALDAALSRMIAALTDLTHPDGGPALFNDSGMSMALAPATVTAAYVGTIAPAPAPQAIFQYPAAGYFGRRDALWYLVTDFGAVGPKDLPAHAHGDIGSFELSVLGKRMIVDPGVYEYNAGDRRDRSRTAASHNVLHIDGGDQAEFYGSFRCGRQPKVNAIFNASADGFDLVGSHDGYLKGPGGLISHRLRAGRRSVHIEDRIDGRRAGAASFGLLLHPDAVPTRCDGAVEVKREDARIVVTADQPIYIIPAVHWPDMGVEQPTHRLVIRLPEGQDRLAVQLAIQPA